MEKTCLYRHYDRDSVLLYVGVSLNAAARLTQHATTSNWFPLIFRVEVEWYDTREAALEAERKAIVLEKPLFNKALQSKGSNYIQHAHDFTRITLRVPSELMNNVKSRARNGRRSLNSEIVQALQIYVRETA